MYVWRLTAALVVVLSCTLTLGTKRAILPTDENTTGAWIAVDLDGSRIHRLVLQGLAIFLSDFNSTNQCSKACPLRRATNRAYTST